MDERIEQLTNMFKDRPWFDSVGYEQYGRVVVYVKEMNQETLYDIPSTCLGKQVLTHFAASKTAQADQFKVPPPKTVNVLSLDEFLAKAKEAQAAGHDVGVGQMLDADDDIEELDSSLLEVDMSHLHDELRKLEKMCHASVLSDIFFEVHDGKNAVTDMSAKYPDVAAKMQALYDEYGFDVLYEELEL